MTLDQNTYKVLKHISKYPNGVPYKDVVEKFKKNINPNAEESIFHLSAINMTYTDYDADNDGNRTSPLAVTITMAGKSIIEEQQDRDKKHWQNILLPQTLNIIVSAITAIVTFFILQWLNTK